MDPLDILIRYRKVRRHRDFDLRKFVENHFWLPEVYSSAYVSDPQNSLKEHIDQLQTLIEQLNHRITFRSSLCWRCRSHRSLSIGGRFSETYYWDSLFNDMLGLAESGREDLLKCMADNFAWMIENQRFTSPTPHHYLSRSQPPVFALMVELFEEDGAQLCAPLSRPPENGICLLDGRCRIVDPSSGLSPCCADAGRGGAQPLLGRSRHAA